MQDHEQSDLIDRINKLENQNRRIRTFLAGLVITALGLATIGAAVPESSKPDDIRVEQIQARSLIISDNEGRDRLILQVERGEPALKMLNHKGQQQVFLGIHEGWEDAAYLSVSSRLESGEIDKQAVLAATTSHPDFAGSTQLMLYDAMPRQKNAGRRHFVRLSTGQQEQKPFFMIHETMEKGAGEITLDDLHAKIVKDGQRILLNTTSNPATLSGVRVTGP